MTDAVAFYGPPQADGIVGSEIKRRIAGDRRTGKYRCTMNSYDSTKLESLDQCMTKISVFRIIKRAAGTHVTSQNLQELLSSSTASRICSGRSNCFQKGHDVRVG